MPGPFARFGNNLYTGATSIDFVGKRRIWYTIAVAMLIASVIIPIARGGFNFGIEFRGGSQFEVTKVQTVAQGPAENAVHSVVPNAVVHVTSVNDDAVRVLTDQLTSDQSKDVSAALAKAYDVPESEVASSFIGASWGADVTEQSIKGLIVFLALAFIAMALYFRTWKMSLAALVSLLHDLVITAGVYAATGFEVTPAAMIGFLTILAYSLYDTVVVFDKIRENTAEDADQFRRTYAQSVNLAVNQTLVRSINTAVVASLPVAAILFLGAFALGADTLRDISLALFVGIIAGTYSTIFLAAPMYAHLREIEPAIKKHDKKALARTSSAREVAESATAG